MASIINGFDFFYYYDKRMSNNLNDEKIEKKISNQYF